MVLVIVFLALSIAFGWLYLFSQPKFSFDKLLFSLWSAAIGFSQLQLSPYESPWTIKFWLMIILFFTAFYLTYKYSGKLWQKTIISSQTETARPKLFFIIILTLSVLSLIANAYIFARFGTLPILSSLPDKMRFIINRQVFGLWEYAALLPRIFIPLAFIFLLTKRGGKLTKALTILVVVIGFFILSLYASRATIIFALLLCFFSYLIINREKINYKKIAAAAAIILLLVIIISITIPALRQYITYRDYYSDIDYQPFTYLADLSDLKIPDYLDFVTPLYIIPAFNLQAIMRGTNFYQWEDFYWGRYSLSVFPTFNQIKIPWKEIFLPWWVTATFLFNYWADWGWLGIIGAAIFWGSGLSLIYNWSTKKTGLLPVLIFAYFSFTVIMSIYTNYLMREEFYLDMALILIIGLIIDRRHYPRSPVKL
ncbi:MAG TPA: O-antigen polymerase [bacterium]|nr:O-antigen polymerase [bacterium]HPN81408.1 O-antigen polymerase [bacterium]HPW39104.1 O-antigen polymerase [bacterium]